MPANWTLTRTKYLQSDDILGWNLESPQPGPEAGDKLGPNVRFRGWLLTESGAGRVVVTQGGTVLADMRPDLSRPDVIRARLPDGMPRPGMERCGFDVTLPRRPGPYRLEVHTARPAGAAIVFDILDTEAGPYALEGGNRMLFLGGDSNDSITQFTKTQSLSDASLRSWQANFAAMQTWQATFNIQIVLLVAPAKEEIFPEFFPLPRARQTILDDFRRKFADKPMLAPIHALRAQRQFTYCETDTHWTDHGASIAAREVLRYWQIDEKAVDALPQQFRVHQRQGDLGIKLDPRRASYELVFAEDPDRFLVFDNGVRNQGCIRVWRNPAAALHSGCLIFGDSFGTNFAQSLTGVFAEVVYAYRPAGFDPVLVGLVRPSHVILQITQRFVHGAPERSGSVFDTAVAKIKALPKAEQEHAITRLRAAAQGPCATLIAPHLERL